MLRLSIDLTKIGEMNRNNHGAISVSEKNGKKYLNATVWLNETEDQHGNIGSVQVWDKATNSKEYVGNLKESTTSNTSNQVNTSSQTVTTSSQTDTTSNVSKNDDLPF